MVNLVHILVLMLLLFLNIPALLYPQARQFKFERLSVEEGLSGSSVACILRDSKGYLWIGAVGLNKYDGYNFKTFKQDPNSLQSLSNNAVSCLFEDHQGTLWIGTVHGGLNKFDPATENFRHFQHNQENPLSLSNNNVRSILEYPKGLGNLWVSTRFGGINYFDSKTETFKHYRFDPENQASLDSDGVIVSYIDRQGIMWVGTDSGLNRFMPVSKKFQRFHHDPQDLKSLSPGKVFSIFEDRNNVLWVGTISGLNRFDRTTETFQHYRHDPQNPQSLSDNVISAIHSDWSGALWIGTENGGLNYFDPKNEIFQCFKHDPTNPWSIQDNYITTIYQDITGEIWVGTKDGGVSRCNPSSSAFWHLQHEPTSPSGLSSNKVSGICEDQNGRIWVGTRDNGLELYDRKTGTFQHFRYNPADPQNFGWNFVSEIYQDYEDTIWIGTMVGLYRFEGKKEPFHRFIPDSQKVSSLKGNVILSIYEDSNNSLWIGTWQRGLYRYDRNTKSSLNYFHVPENKRSLSDNDISCIYEAPSEPGILWVGTYKGGLNRFDPTSETSRYYMHDPQNPKSLSNNSVYTIHEDSLGILWVGTANGLNAFQRKTESFNRYGIKEDLPSEMLWGILGDDRGNLWISGNKGLSKFNLESQTFKNFDIPDGLQSSEFGQYSYSRLRSGEMVFGGNNGFNIFHPDSVKDNPFVPPVVFTSLRRYNAEGSKGSATEEIGVSEKKEVAFSYNENIFTVEFAALNFRIPEKNQYAYKLEGFSDQWIQLGTKHDITFTNLDLGEYILRVKGSNNDGIWNEEGASLRLSILPPWWKTWWAYSFYAMLVGVAFYGIRRFEINRQRLAIHAENLEGVDRLKSRFFANISHEFRTPLTLILGPLEKLTLKASDQKSRQELCMMQRNAKRLLQLINQLLDLSKLEAGGMKLQARPENIIPLLRGLTFSFKSLASQNGIDLQFQSQAEEIIVYLEQDKVEKIFTNLISNAFKFTGKRGSIQVAVAGGSDKDLVEIHIRDTGCGIPAEHLDKIFDRFYQVDDAHTRETGGSGIGLALTKELVDLHHGTISVTSEPGKGTTFTIHLPLGNEHLHRDEIACNDGSDQIADRPYPKPEEQIPITRVEQSANQPSARPRSEKPRLVLIVEDNHDMRAYMRGHLETDHKIIEAENGEEGFKLARKSAPALIISDVMMPKMDGFQFCEKVKSDARISHIPVILLTAKASGESKIEGLETGADDYLTKPFDAKELLTRVKNLIEQRHRLQERFHRDLRVQPKEITVTSVDEALLQNVIRIVDENMTNDDFDTATLARQAGISRGHLNKKLRALTNCSSREFVRTLRLKRAAQLLEHGYGNVTEVAYEVGFNSLAHFAKIFREQFGVAPKEYVSLLKTKSNPPSA